MDTQLCADPADQAAKEQGKYRTADHDTDQKRELFHLIPGNNINHIFTGDAADESQTCAKNTEKNIKENGTLISGTVGKNPLPVVDNFRKASVQPAGDQDVDRFPGRVVFCFFMVQ